MANPAVVVDFVANTKDLQKGFDDAGRQAGGLGSKLKGLGVAGAAAGFAALAGAVKVGVGEFMEAQKIGAQTNAVLKSTGNAANTSADQISGLAESLMKKSGVDDEAIQSGENLLLTFTNIRNEAGKGNDVFDQTTKAALDMSVALGTDMKTASMQLGKALNDPIKGMTKLQRSGVTFTEAQKAAVEQMVKTGDTLGAQKLILGEVNKEFGGSAEAAGKTLPGQLNILKESFSNLAGVIVGKLVPPFAAILGFMVDHQTTVLIFAGIIGTLAGAVIAVAAATAAWNAIQLISEGLTIAWAAAQWLLNTALLANPIGLVVVAVAALIAAFVVVTATSETFRNIVSGAFNAVQNAAVAVFDWLKANWPLLTAILTGPFGLAVLAIVKNWDTIKQGLRDAVAAIQKIWNAFIGWIKEPATKAFTEGIQAIAKVWDFLSDGAKTAVGWIKDAFNDLITFLKGIVQTIKDVVTDIVNAIKRPINAIIDAWNALEIPRVEITIPSFTIPGTNKTIGGGSIGFGPFPFPDIPRLAAGGIISTPTLAMVGEGQGREIVAPESLLRDIVGDPNVEVRVFIGETELRGLVRSEVRTENTRTAQVLMSGAM